VTEGLHDYRRKFGRKEGRKQRSKEGRIKELHDEKEGNKRG
jgi:hypothetical protein